MTTGRWPCLFAGPQDVTWVEAEELHVLPVNAPKGIAFFALLLQKSSDRGDL